MTNIFDSYDLVGLDLPNRIVMAPLTRSRAANDIANEMTALYYTQRATAGLGDQSAAGIRVSFMSTHRSGSATC
jgi:2,4-dienoyl-CoA reductase-like NADH-dependent reductase (Old Yellow Enzyme family)